MKYLTLILLSISFNVNAGWTTGLADDGNYYAVTTSTKYNNTFFQVIYQRYKGCMPLGIYGVAGIDVEEGEQTSDLKLRVDTGRIYSLEVDGLNSSDGQRLFIPLIDNQSSLLVELAQGKTLRLKGTGEVTNSDIIDVFSLAGSGQALMSAAKKCTAQKGQDAEYFEDEDYL